MFVRVCVRVCFCMLLAAVAGCSVHPLPDDLSRKDTYAIIENVRCEARAAVKRHLQALLLRSPSSFVKSMNPEDVVENLKQIMAHDPDTGATIERYRLSVIAYIFTFDITEDNNATNGDLFFTLPWSHSTFTLDIDGSVEKNRFNSRKIRVVETFEELDALKCPTGWEPRENLVYPILGSIGMTEVVDSFFSLAESVGQQKKFSDILTYTTTIDGTADPELDKKAVLHSFRLTKASFKLLAKRKDVHMVVVALTFPVKQTPIKTTVQVSKQALSRAPAAEVSEIVSDTKKQAAEEVCIQEALIQEQLTGAFRVNPPEKYCRNDLRRY